MRLVGDQCSLRPFRREDEPSVASLANNRAIARNLGDEFPHPYTLEDAREWISARLADPEPATHLAIEVGGDAVGGIGLGTHGHQPARVAEVGYWLGEPYWGRGIASEALRLFRDYAFARFELHRLFACVVGWNRASARVLEKTGFRL